MSPNGLFFFLRIDEYHELAYFTSSFMKKGVMFMLKIIKNNSGIRELQRHKYILYTEVNGKPAYAKIGLRQIFGYIALKIKYR